jgi:NADPH:quinone reductase-like Zn-dependent oxidoreductase
LYGITVVATCSPRNFEHVKEAGATHVFDYRDEHVIDKIQAVAPRITRVFDTIGNATSSAAASRAIGDSSGILCTVRPGKANTQDVSSNVRVTDIFVFTAFPTPHTYRGSLHWPVSRQAIPPEYDVFWLLRVMLTKHTVKVHMANHQLSTELYDQLPTLLGSGSLKPLPTLSLGKLSPSSVQQAMDMNRSGQVSAKKLCFEAFEALVKSGQ